MAKNNNLILIFAALGAFLFMNKAKSAPVTVNRPGATPVIPAYNQSPAFAGRAVQQQGAQVETWGQLGSAIGKLFNQPTPGPAADNGIYVPDVGVQASSDTSWSANNDTNVCSAAPGLPTVNPWADMAP